ncbi:MAG: hypothetical protein JO008_18875, partial [Alphaproteobacteria bacterium]|nr:hypothetical protein [Alphaproteobacteria bacterium]
SSQRTAKLSEPLALALLAGSNNLIKPEATSAAIFPAFLFIAGTMIAVALAYQFLGVETHGQPIALDPEERPPRASRPGLAAGN